ncbi:MAG: hypothetical protein JSR18_13260 [Proteobacteria bacterium]|nr:hypothetical protein [Pseudomonadota bacterium]
MDVTPLRFPAHYPPTEPWKKFFLGIRWLGPDLSFFEALGAAQARRPVSALTAWDGGRRQQLAEGISRIVAQRRGWRSDVFVPADSAAVVFHGPRFWTLDPPEVLGEIGQFLLRDCALELPERFWRDKDDWTFGELVDAVLTVACA